MLTLKDQTRWRVFKNDEGDPILKGKHGVISLYADGDLDIWVQKTRVFAQMERIWKAKQHWDDGGLFIRPWQDLDQAAKYLKCVKKRHLSPEQQKQCAERLRKWHSTRKNPTREAPSAAKPLPNAQ